MSKSKLKNTYYFLRHGQSIKNIKKLSSCWPEKFYSPLTKKGIAEAREAAEKIKKKNIDLIFCSDLLRTKQTAAIVGRAIGQKPKTDKRLRDINVGIFNGWPISETGKFWDKEKKLTPLQYYAKRFESAPPKGETYAAAGKRFKSFVREKEKKYRNKNILIVGHERLFTLSEKAICGYSMKKFVNIVINKKEIKTGEARKLKC